VKGGGNGVCIHDGCYPPLKTRFGSRRGFAEKKGEGKEFCFRAVGERVQAKEKDNNAVLKKTCMYEGKRRGGGKKRGNLKNRKGGRKKEKRNLDL